MSDNKNKETEGSSVKNALDDALSSLEKALDNVRNDSSHTERPEKNQDEESTKTLDIKPVLYSYADDISDTKPIALKQAAKGAPDVRVVSKKTEETVADTIAETIKDNVRRENAAHSVPDVIIKKSEDNDVRLKKTKDSWEHKRFFYAFNSVFVTLVFVCITAALFILERPSGFMQSENRNYATFPEFSFRSYFDGEYTKKISEFFTDTTPKREELKTVANAFTGLFGFKLDNMIIKNSNKNVNKEKFDGNITITTVTPATFPPRENTTSAVTTTAPVNTGI